MEFLTLAKYYSTYSTSGIDSLWATLSLFFGMFIGVIIVSLALVILIYAAYWGILKKAGKEGIDGIIPIHNEICLLEICGVPKWMWFLNLIPFGAIVFVIILAIYVARSFGKSVSFTVGLIFLPFVFYPMLAWGNAQYIGKTWGMVPQPQYQPQPQPQYQPQQQYQAPQQPQQPVQPQNPGNNVPPQQ